MATKNKDIQPCANCTIAIDLEQDGHMLDPKKGLLCLDCALWFNNGQKPSKTPWGAEPEEASDGRRIAICSPTGDAIVAGIPPEDLPADARDWTEAAFLIKAANSHDDLVKALEHAVAMMEASIDRYGDPARLFDLDHYRAVLYGAEAQSWENCLVNAPQRILKLLGLADKADCVSESRDPKGIEP